MKLLSICVEISGVALIVVAAGWVFVPAGVAVAGAYLVYLSWDGGDHGDSD